MSTPLKSVNLLLRKHLSPRISPNKLLSVSDIQSNVTPKRLENKKLATGLVQEIQTNIRIKIDDSYTKEEDSFMLNTHTITNLLSQGLNKYDLFYLIGKGSFGTVIKAKYKGQIVAAKLVKFSKSFPQINEENMLQLVHKNIVQCFDVIVSEKYALILMEFCKDSNSLQDIINDLSIDLKVKNVKYSQDVANGLAFCHQNNILHLDIKPKNVLLCWNDICKICDFGNSINVLNTHHKYRYQGTVAYTAPEILKGNPPSSKCDIYSLGILIWQLFTRKFPYECICNEVLIYKVVKYNLRPSIEFSNQALKKLCELCWHNDANERPSALDVSYALDAM